MKHNYCLGEFQPMTENCHYNCGLKNTCILYKSMQIHEYKIKEIKRSFPVRTGLERFTDKWGVNWQNATRKIKTK